MYRLTEGIIRDMKKLFEGTQGSNIAYLPSQLGMIAPPMQALSRIKKTWHLTFLESKGNSRIVNFEDMLKVEVKNEDFVHFLENVLHLTTLPMDSNVNLTQYLKEAFEEDIENSYKELKEKLLDLVSVQPFVSADLNFEGWRNIFGIRGYSSSKDILIKFETFKTDIDRLMLKLREEIQDDKGQLDILINTIGTRGTLNKFPIFKDFKYLIGSIVNSEYYNVNLIYNVTVSMGYSVQESVTVVNDENLIEEIGSYRGIKTVKDSLFPVGGVFTPRFFHYLRDVILDRI
jgi:hypothetical protein